MYPNSVDKLRVSACCCIDAPCLVLGIDAQRQLETTLNLEPENYRANLVLGRVLTLNGKPVLALFYLKKAALLQPSAPDPHLFMADSFARLGQKANAHREQTEGQRLRGTNER